MQQELQERRRKTRISTMFLCELAFDEDTVELARVRDMSEVGIKIATARPLQLGDRLRVRLPGGLDWVVARVAWRAQGVAGLSFARLVRLPQVSGADPDAQATIRRAG